MTPGTVLLLGPMPAELPDQLESLGLVVLSILLPAVSAQQQVTASVLAVRTARPVDPVVLLATPGVGALVPAVGRALAIAGSRVGGYLFVDAELPGRVDAGLLDPVQLGDWPDAPCGYLQLSPERAAEARLARLRGWPVLESDDVAAAVAGLIDQL
jgi:hypothetical protein